MAKKENKKDQTIKKELGEFKQFIMRGNVLDMAIGVIMGGAFGKIVTSIVNDILMPFIGLLLGGLDFSSLHIRIKDATITYGMFIQNVIDFLIIAGCLFMMIKFISRFTHKEEKKEEVKTPSEEVLLLQEIRDLLKKEQGKKKHDEK